MSGMFDTTTNKSQRKQEIALKEQKTKRKGRIITIAVISAFLLITAVSVLLNSGWIRRAVSFVTIDDISFNIAEYEYFFNNEYMSISEDLKAQGWEFMLPEKGRGLRQLYDATTGQTWYDAIDERVLMRLQGIVAVNKAAQAAGYTITQEQLDEIDSSIDMEGLYAILYGFPSMTAYLQQVYGPGMTEDLYKEIAIYTYTAESYVTHMRDNLSYTPEQLDKYSTDNADLMDIFKYRVFVIRAEEPEAGVEEYGTALAEAIEEARRIAEAYIAGVTGEEEFIAAAYDYDEFTYASPDAFMRQLQGADLDNPDYIDNYYASWLRDSSRKPGDMTVVESYQGVAAIYFISRDDNHYPTVGMQQILITPQSVAPDDFEMGQADSEYFAALEALEEETIARAQNVYSLFNEQGATREALISLREEYSDPDGSEDGLFENISRFTYQGISVSTMQVMPQLEEWLFEDGRAVGDSVMIETSYGFHIMYFTGFGELFSRIMADDLLRTVDNNEWIESLPKDTPVRHNVSFLLSV